MTQKIKLLFIANAYSTHTHSWVELIQDPRFDIRLFGIENSVPPDSFTIPTYAFRRAFPDVPFDQQTELAWLAKIIQDWQPDVIHTLGFYNASFHYLETRKRNRPAAVGKWVVTSRGGPELALNRLLVDEAPRLQEVLCNCDQFIADNRQNYDYAIDLGLEPAKVSPIGIAPGTGGIDITAMGALAQGLPSQRKRVILWPKAYECPASKALPVFEALRLCYEEIAPCQIFMTAMCSEAVMWFQTLPQTLRESCCCLEDRMPRGELLRLMGMSRVMLAPSLIDGIPNSLYEAMATGAFPVVSPLDTITTVINENNALFARNLYPDEIARVLVKAMNDDDRVDRGAQLNRSLVARIANREIIREKVTNNYLSLATTPQSFSNRGANAFHPD